MSKHYIMYINPSIHHMPPYIIHGNIVIIFIRISRFYSDLPGTPSLYTVHISRYSMCIQVNPGTSRYAQGDGAFRFSEFVCGCVVIV